MKQSVQDLLDEDDTETFVKWISAHGLLQLREDVVCEKRVWQRTLRTPLWGALATMLICIAVMCGFVLALVAVAHTEYRTDLPWLKYIAQAATCGGFGVFGLGAWVAASDFGGSLRAWFTHRVMLFDLNYALGCIDAERYVRLARMQANAANEDPEEIRALQLN